MQSDEVRICRSSRRSRVVLRIAEDGIAELLVPAYFSDSAAQQVIAENASVITRLRQRAELNKSARPVFSDNGQLLFCGKSYPLYTSIRLRSFNGERFMIPAGTETERLDAIEALYKTLAKQYIIPRTAELAAKFGLSVGKIKINSATTRWGSCSASGNLNFSWQLIRCPEELIDSVICHELAHRLELNHSPKFYKALKTLDPLYMEHRTALRRFSRENPWFR